MFSDSEKKTTAERKEKELFEIRYIIIYDTNKIYPQTRNKIFIVGTKKIILRLSNNLLTKIMFCDIIALLYVL